MKNSATISELKHDLRTRLLDVLYTQWGLLGFPFAAELEDAPEVIDPEALLWCSLELLPDEPRLGESVVDWFAAHGGDYLVFQRINSRMGDDESRALLWNALARPRDAISGGGKTGLATFAAQLAQKTPVGRVGRPVRKASTVLLHARNLFGKDLRSHALLCVLGAPPRVRIQDIEQHTGYAYRSIAAVVSRWEAAGVCTVNRGEVRLLEPQPWLKLLGCDAGALKLVGWFAAFEATLLLLRQLARAEDNGLSATSSVVRGLADDARKQFEDAKRLLWSEAPSLSHLEQADVFAPEPVPTR